MHKYSKEKINVNSVIFIQHQTIQMMICFSYIE